MNMIQKAAVNMLLNTCGNPCKSCRRCLSSLRSWMGKLHTRHIRTVRNVQRMKTMSGTYCQEIVRGSRFKSYTEVYRMLYSQRQP